MKKPRAKEYSILCVPNLQGNKNTPNLNNAQLDWTSIKPTLPQQAQEIQASYRDHHFLLGTSFGGLAAWLFLVTKRPEALRGLILLDTLPSLQYFPRRKRITHRLLLRTPESIGQAIYNLIRHQQGQQKQTDLKPILQRIQSIYEHFPSRLPEIPTLVLSKNPKFHQEWSQQAEKHAFLTAKLYRDPSMQISRWISSLSN